MPAQLAAIPGAAVRTAARYAVLLIVLTFCLFPILWVIGMSVKLPGEYMRNPPVWIPATSDTRALPVGHARAGQSGAEKQPDHRQWRDGVGDGLGKLGGL